MDKKNQSYVVLAGYLKEYTTDLKKLQNENKIIEKHVSTQMIQIPNPSYIKGITDATQPEVVTAVIITALFLIEPKIKN